MSGRIYEWKLQPLILHRGCIYSIVFPGDGSRSRESKLVTKMGNNPKISCQIPTNSNMAYFLWFTYIKWEKKNNKHAGLKWKGGIWAPNCLTESDSSEHPQWYGANSSLNFSSTVEVKEDLFIKSTHSNTAAPKSSTFHLFLGDW